MKRYKQRHFEDTFQAGFEFQDWVTDRLWEKGIALNAYVSLSRGAREEGRSGIEVKLDSRYRETGCLWIEYEERSHPDGEWRPGLLQSNPFPWLIIIGDQIEAFALPGVQVKVWCRKNYLEYQKETKTSRGVLMPIEVARSISLFELRS